MKWGAMKWSAQQRICKTETEKLRNFGNWEYTKQVICETGTKNLQNKYFSYNIFQILLRNTLGIEKMEIIVSDIICDVNDLSRIFQGHSWGRMAGGGAVIPQRSYKVTIKLL